MKKVCVVLIVLFVGVLVGCASSQTIGTDKYYHFAAGATSASVANEINFPEVTSVFVAGFAKETYDYIQYGNFDTKDLIATTLGGLVIKCIIKFKKIIDGKNIKKHFV